MSLSQWRNIFIKWIILLILLKQAIVSYTLTQGSITDEWKMTCNKGCGIHLIYNTRAQRDDVWLPLLL